MTSRIKIFANKILSEFHILEPPVPIVQIVKIKNITIKYVPKPGWHTASRRTGDKRIIWINSDLDNFQQRFCAAHSFWHMLQSCDAQYRCCHQNNNFSEKRANEFANEILMPTWMVSVMLDYANGDAEKMSKMFQVSRVAMGLRLHDIYA